MRESTTDIYILQNWEMGITSDITLAASSQKNLNTYELKTEVRKMADLNVTDQTV